MKAVIQLENEQCVQKKIGIKILFFNLISFLISSITSDAARECRRKKKEYINCLEERVTGLETQNKALIEELRELKELYCKREETSNNNTPNKTTSNTR